jgi:hypothetical protein
MQKVKKNHSNQMILIGCIVFGIAIGIIFSYGFVALDNAGAFGGGTWEPLKSKFKFEHIQSATTLTVWAETIEHKLYEQTYCLGNINCNQWTETKEVVIGPGRDDGTVVINKDTCIPNGLKYPSDPRGNILECALATRYWSNETRDIIYYALLDDGSIWVWRSGGPWYVTLDMYTTLISPFIGLAFGVFIYRSFLKFQHRKIIENI